MKQENVTLSLILVMMVMLVLMIHVTPLQQKVANAVTQREFVMTVTLVLMILVTMQLVASSPPRFVTIIVAVPEIYVIQAQVVDLLISVTITMHALLIIAGTINALSLLLIVTIATFVLMILVTLLEDVFTKLKYVTTIISVQTISVPLIEVVFINEFQEALLPLIVLRVVHQLKTVLFQDNVSIIHVTQQIKNAMFHLH